MEDHLRSLGCFIIFFLGGDEDVIDVVQEGLGEGDLLQTL